MGGYGLHYIGNAENACLDANFFPFEISWIAGGMVPDETKMRKPRDTENRKYESGMRKMYGSVLDVHEKSKNSIIKGWSRSSQIGSWMVKLYPLIELFRSEVLQVFGDESQMEVKAEQ